MPSQLSQIVLAPASIIASHDGTVSWKSSSNATSACPVSARTGRGWASARKPVDRWVPLARISSTSRAAAWGRSSSGTSPKANARTRLAWVSGRIAPSASMNSVRHASRAFVGELRPAIGVAVPAEYRRGSGEDRRRAVQVRGGDIGDVRLLGEDALRVAPGLTPLPPVEAAVPEVGLVRSGLAVHPGRVAAVPSRARRRTRPTGVAAS